MFGIPLSVLAQVAASGIPTETTPVVFQDHGWRRYDRISMAFSGVFGIVLVLLGVVFLGDSGMGRAPPIYVGPVLIVPGIFLAMVGIRAERALKRVKVTVFPSRVEVINGRRGTTVVPASHIAGFEAQACDAFQTGLVQAVSLRTTDGATIRLPLMGHRSKVQRLVEELDRAVGLSKQT